VKLKHPTPFGVELVIKAKPTEIEGNKVTIEAELIANEKITSKFIGVFIAVDQNHPAFHRWD
jgi:predicted thioesterase